MMAQCLTICAMNRSEAIGRLRRKLRRGGKSIGSWMQIPDGSVAEIMGNAGYDWIAVDLEHGSISIAQLPDLFRALELGNTLPLARLAAGTPGDCKQALDAGAAGVIVPMISSAAQLAAVRDSCRWPPAGNRGVGYSRANLFGKRFTPYQAEAQSPLLVALIEQIQALDDLEAILEVDGLDAVLIGPYDLSASMGITEQFDDRRFSRALRQIRAAAKKAGIPCGVHVVAPSPAQLRRRLKEGYRFLAYSLDGTMLHTAAANPESV